VVSAKLFVDNYCVASTRLSGAIFQRCLSAWVDRLAVVPCLSSPLLPFQKPESISGGW
jgi:hypothetical protein